MTTLKKYLQHLSGCPKAYNVITSKERVCACGLDEALAESLLTTPAAGGGKEYSQVDLYNAFIAGWNKFDYKEWLNNLSAKKSPTHQEAEQVKEGEKSDIMECESCGWKGDEKDIPDFYYDSEGNKWNDPVCPKCDSTDIDYIKPPPSASAEQEKGGNPFAVPFKISERFKPSPSPGTSEGEDSIYIRKYTYDEMKKSWDAGKSNKAAYQETNTIDFEDFIRSIPAPTHEKDGGEDATSAENILQKHLDTMPFNGGLDVVNTYDNIKGLVDFILYWRKSAINAMEEYASAREKVKWPTRQEIFDKVRNLSGDDHLMQDRMMLLIDWLKSKSAASGN